MKIKKLGLLVVFGCSIILMTSSSYAGADIMDSAGSSSSIQMPNSSLTRPQTTSNIFKNQCIRWDTRCGFVPECAQWANNPNDNCFYCRRVEKVKGHSAKATAKVVCNDIAMLHLRDYGFNCVRSHTFNSTRSFGECLRWHRQESCYRVCMQFK